MLRVVFAVLAVLFTAQCVWSNLSSNFSFGMLLMDLFALLFLVLAVFYRPLARFVHTPLGNFLRWVVVLAGTVFAGLIVFVAVSGYLDPPTGQPDAVIVLGAGLRGDRVSSLLRCRLDAAYDYYCEHPEVLIVTTGGQGRDELCPEGAAMKKYLLEKGVPEENLISEEKSTSTEENFAFALELLRPRGIDENSSIVYVTNAFHCYRAGQYAKMAGFENTAALPAGIPLTAILPCYSREVFALLYYWVFRSSRTGFMQPFVGLLAVSKRFFYK